jgi:hypothetical protein
MYRILNIFFLIIILIFSLSIYKYYSSNKNIKARDFNRNNINQIINDKTADLPVLVDDTSSVIIFNNSLSNEIDNKKSRSFWNLLKSK